MSNYRSLVSTTAIPLQYIHTQATKNQDLIVKISISLFSLFDPKPLLSRTVLAHQEMDVEMNVLNQVISSPKSHRQVTSGQV